jgi:hypothetical protein
MFKRNLSKLIEKAEEKYQIISITGPRQSGKTTLSKNIFSDYAYFNLENPLTREFAESDPKAFLDQEKKMVIDEIQRLPDLFSFLQVIVDEDKSRKFVITGSQNFLITEAVSQSLAGRVAIFKLLPLTLKEIQENKIKLGDIYQRLFSGGYPRIYDRDLKPSDWYPNYIQTYLERDVRSIKSIKNLSTFQKFLGLCAGRIGQVLNLSSLANDTGVSVPTIKEWLSVLEASYVIFRLEPFYKNYNKRLIKSPKLYFYDVGLACSLLKIREKKELEKHPLIGNIFETFIIGEIKKRIVHNDLGINLYYFRDRQGNEIDLLYEKEGQINLTEIKSSQTYHQEFSKNFDYFSEVSGEKTKNQIIYVGDTRQTRTNFNLVPWSEMGLVV